MIEMDYTLGGLLEREERAFLGVSEVDLLGTLLSRLKANSRTLAFAQAETVLMASNCEEAARLVRDGVSTEGLRLPTKERLAELREIAEAARNQISSDIQQLASLGIEASLLEVPSLEGRGGSANGRRYNS